MHLVWQQLALTVVDASIVDADTKADTPVLGKV